MLGQDVTARADPWRHILELDPHQQGEFSDMKNAIAPLSKYDDLVPSLFRVAGIIVRFYTLRAQSLVRDRYRKLSS
jgi:hypothetical protein